ncbi:MAG: phage major capsid protein [Candidatus Binatus sp.]
MDYIQLAKEAHGKGQKIIVDVDTKAGGVGKGVLTAEQSAEVDKFFDEAEGHMKNAHRLKREADLKSAIAETVAPTRRHPMGEGSVALNGRNELEFQSPYVSQAIQLGLMRSEAQEKAIATERGQSFLDWPSRSRFVQRYLGQSDMAQVFAREAQAKGIIEAEFKDLTTLTDPEGGAIVDQDFRAQLIIKLRNQVMIRQYATVIATQAGQIGFPVFDPSDSDTDIPTSQPNAAATISSPTNLFGKTAFTPHKRIRIFKVPSELLEDAILDVTSLLTNFFAMRFGEIDENDFLNGNGTGKPLGILAATGLPTAGIKGSTTAMIPEDLINTVYSMRAVYRKNARWMLHRKVLSAIRQFRTAVGGAGTGQFLFQPALVAGQPDMLLGYPILESEFMPSPYDAPNNVAGTPLALFGDFSWYWIIDRTDLMVLRLNELYAGNDQIGVLLRRRTDGAPVLAEPFTTLTRN